MIVEHEELLGIEIEDKVLDSTDVARRFNDSIEILEKLRTKANIRFP